MCLETTLCTWYAEYTRHMRSLGPRVRLRGPWGAPKAYFVTARPRKLCCTSVFLLHSTLLATAFTILLITASKNTGRLNFRYATYKGDRICFLIWFIKKQEIGETSAKLAHSKIMLKRSNFLLTIWKNIVELLSGKFCYKWGYECTIAPFSSSHIDAWLRNWLQSSKALIQIQHSRY